MKDVEAHKRLIAGIEEIQNMPPILHIAMCEDLINRLRKRAEIRRNIHHRKSVINNEPDRIAELLEEAAKTIEILIKPV
jgi:hypothetical protein